MGMNPAGSSQGSSTGQTNSSGVVPCCSLSGGMEQPCRSTLRSTASPSPKTASPGAAQGRVNSCSPKPHRLFLHFKQLMEKYLHCVAWWCGWTVMEEERNLCAKKRFPPVHPLFLSVSLRQFNLHPGIKKNQHV